MDSRSKERAAWVLVAVWCVLIFTSIPLARSIQGRLESIFGRAFFTVLAFSVLFAAFAMCVRFVSQKPGGITASIRLSSIAVIYAVWTWKLRANPEESFHFIEYGVLSLLAYVALSFRVRDALVYVCAALVCSLAGTMDEVIQWLTPFRTFDFRDIALNAFAGALVQTAIATGIRPSLEKTGSGHSAGRSAARFLLSVQLLLLALCFSNTPAAVNFYTVHLPFLSYLKSKENMMADYGHRHETKEGIFFSRFDLDELPAVDERKAQEAGSVLRSLKEGSPYLDLIKRYSPLSDPFIHEALVRLFRRDEYAGRGIRGEPAPCAASFHEEAILEKYFQKTLHSSGAALSHEAKKALKGCADLANIYRSPVSGNLITRFSLREVWIVFFAAVGVIWLPAFSGLRQGRPVSA